MSLAHCMMRWPYTFFVAVEREARRLIDADDVHVRLRPDLRFHADRRALIPRSFIGDILADDALPLDPRKVKRVLDLCTGSGCLAVLLAHAYPHAIVDAIDISSAAMEVARRNVQDYGLGERVRLVESDLFAALGSERYDVIVSNPPYVTEAAMQDLPPEYRSEPAMALAGGSDGLVVVRRILLESKSRLTRNGVLVVEVGAGREMLEAAYPDVEFTWLETGAGDEQVFLLERGQLPG
jgi:ribosomal protein L3 glutamine methyltransferase